MTHRNIRTSARPSLFPPVRWDLLTGPGLLIMALLLATA